MTTRDIQEAVASVPTSNLSEDHKRDLFEWLEMQQRDDSASTLAKGQRFVSTETRGRQTEKDSVDREVKTRTGAHRTE
jgi:hypothetical protein